MFFVLSTKLINSHMHNTSIAIFHSLDQMAANLCSLEGRNS